MVWRFQGRSRRVAEELRKCHPGELQSIFLWGSHTSYRRPSDVYSHLIHGWVYENRKSWPKYWKICSENDAHALFVALSGLGRATGKSLYGLLKSQLLLSVLARQEADGGWRHGEWTEHMESHFRLCASAMHLCHGRARGIARSMSYATACHAPPHFWSRGRDALDCGVWFLHDELELNEESMAQAPFPWVRTRVLGKSPTNMLVLNTHLDTMIALDRYAEISGDRQHAHLVDSARGSTRAVLSLRPAEALYRLLFWPIGLTLLPRAEQERLPVVLRALKRIAWKYVIPNLHRVKARFPRFVMPGGYIDRAIPLKGWAFHYLTVNLMDLVRYGRRFREAGLPAVTDQAFAFTHQSGILLRWAELDYEKYALGFWAEALYQRCLDDDCGDWRAWLVEVALLLEDLGMGLPPSVLGANGEAVAKADRHPCLQTPRLDVRVVNLSMGDRREFLLINCGKEPAPVPSALYTKAGFVALDARGASVEPASVPARSCLRLLGRTVKSSSPVPPVRAH